jgi:hypothetical protein
MKKQMLKRKDGSVSQRGLWDNIRANKGSGKKPTTAMLKQEKMSKMQSGGVTGSIVKPKKKTGRDIDPGFYPKPKPGQKTGKDIDPGFMPKINDSLPKRKIQYDKNGFIQFKKGGLIKKK